MEGTNETAELWALVVALEIEILTLVDDFFEKIQPIFNRNIRKCF